MSKQHPTKAQISYLKSLCKKYSLEFPLNEEEASRLDYKNAISEILEKTGGSAKNELPGRLKELFDINSQSSG